MNDLFLRACRGEAVERRPVWIMRQAGRYLPQYREVRQRVDFLTLCRTPELAARVTLQPLEALGVDAAILFADILLLPEAMGARLEFLPGDGPSFPEPVRSAADVARLGRPDPEARLGHVLETIRTLRRELLGRVPLIGFGGAPWTLACYLVEGGASKTFAHILGWSYEDPAGLARLLDRIGEASADYLEAQVEAGAQAIQVFDTWAGLLDAPRWRRLALPSLLRALEPLRGRVPLIYYALGGGHLLEAMADLPVEVLSVDWRLPLDAVRQRVGPAKVLQGNLDPAALLGPAECLDGAVRDLVARCPEGRHVINLGHGILPSTPVENARRFVEAAQRLSSTASS